MERIKAIILVFNLIKTSRKILTNKPNTATYFYLISNSKMLIILISHKYIRDSEHNP